MRIFELNRYNIPEKILGAWIKEVGEDLLPVQERSIKLYNILDGRSLLISSPDTLGKTFLGEIAAVKYALERKRVAYLVPSKSVAEEKHSKFRKKYEPYGIESVVSSRRIRKYDQLIEAGEFGMAVVEYERMLQLFATNPFLLRYIDLVIIDEIQNIGHPNLGPGLEVTMTKMITSSDRPQIFGFMPVLCRAERLAEWLEVDFMCHNRRAVDVREDRIRNVFHYDACYDSRKKVEKPIGLASDETADILISNVAFFVERGEQIVFYLEGKRDTMAFARILVDRVDLPGASGALEELTVREETLLNRCLKYCLQRSIAFYHSDLSRGEQNIIEKYADKGEIRVIFCTPSPPLGVNLPAATFLLHTCQRKSDSRNHLAVKSIMWAEYENVCGSAKNPECGRELETAYISGGQCNREEWEEEGGRGTPASRLIGKGLEDQLVCIIGTGSDRARLEKFLARTFMGMNASRDDIKKYLDKALRILLEAGMIEPSGQNEFRATAVGNVSAVRGISYHTVCELVNFLRNACSRKPTDNEILKAVASTYDARKVTIETALREQKKMQCDLLMSEIFPCSIFENRENYAAPTLQCSPLGDEEAYKTKHIRPLERWIQGLDTPPLERDHESYCGNLATIAEGMSLIIDAASLISQSMGMPKPLQDRLSILSERLLFGVEEKGLELARLRVRGLGRAGIQKLLSEGLGTREAIRETSLKRLAVMIPEGIAIRLKEAVESVGEAFPKPESRVRIFSIDDTFICRDRIEVTGKPMEKRNLVIINGTSIGITNRSMELLLQLVIALKRDGKGWIHKEDMTPRIEAAQLISRLRTELRSFTLAKNSKIIENDGSGCYRLSIPPQNVVIDTESLMQHWNAVIRELAKMEFNNCS
jgi:replicative superfamily II helicase